MLSQISVSPREERQRLQRLHSKINKFCSYLKENYEYRKLMNATDVLKYSYMHLKNKSVHTSASCMRPINTQNVCLSPDPWPASECAFVPFPLFSLFFTS